MTSDVAVAPRAAEPTVTAIRPAMRAARASWAVIEPDQMTVGVSM